MTGFLRIFRSLQFPHFRNFFLAQNIVMTGVSLGSLSASVQLAYRKNILRLERDILQAGFLWGLMFLLVAFNQILWLNWFLLVLLGHGVVVQFGSNITTRRWCPKNTGDVW